MLDVLGLGPDLVEAYGVAVGRVVWSRAELLDAIARTTSLTADQAAAGVAGLLAAGVLREAEGKADGIRVVPPALALRTRLVLRRSELAENQQRLEEADAMLAGLQDRWSEARDSQAAQVMEHITGIDVLRGRLEQMAAGTLRETLSLLPAHVLTPESIESSRALDAETLGRGVAVRTVVVESAMRRPATAGYLRWLSEQGAEIRTVAALPMRLVVSDRVLAILPIDAESPRDGALVVRAAGLLTALVALFETVWRGAKPIDVPRPPEPAELDDVGTAILRILATGATDEAVSRQLGLSVRTVRRSISGLMGQLHASSRFELGLALGARGWSVNELPGTDGPGPAAH
ncbi:helix-turn-helix transcriptional regulator [Pseudonocardia kongjuensis]|uniref:Helix-turn-helix transcriptional regulator n=1 Tax=Pseudonocardia kongjuensis TaxID=102227 RepID=A0ABP4IKY9_9PSEU